MREERPNILYVDDESANLRSFKAAFRRDYKVFLAESAKEGVEVLRENDINIIITDQRMPEMTGVQFLESINNEFTEQVRMILTGFSDMEAVIDAINSGNVYRYITKPWDEDELRQVIDGAFKMYSLQQDNRGLLTELHDQVNQLERTMKLFQKYVPEDVVKEHLAAKEGHSVLAGESREIAIMFTDVRNFTSISSNLKAEEVVEFLNEYFGLMNQIIVKYNGTLNKFMGDGILAIFGAPVNHLTNAENAVMCGVEMTEKVKIISDKYAPKFGRDVNIGVGINTGVAVVGTIGSEERVEYTVIGDSVNVASRIETLTKDTPDSVLISESTYDRVKELVETTAMEPVKVKGKEEFLQIYRVTGRK